MNERLEWDRDGQYYHYLTKWMHALNRVSRTTGDPTPLGWAMELAKTAHARFTYAPPAGGPKRMFWKMSIDLTHPLVPSMGQHDPLDGFVTYSELQAAASALGGSSLPGLKDEIADMSGILRDIGPGPGHGRSARHRRPSFRRLADRAVGDSGQPKLRKPSRKRPGLGPSGFERLVDSLFSGRAGRAPPGLPRARTVDRALGGRKPARSRPSAARAARS